MKSTSFALSITLVLLGLAGASRLKAQTSFTILHTFSATNNNTNNDGATPYAGLVLSGGTLYGTTSAGGSSGDGTVFALNTNGTGFTVLHSFVGSDGANPLAGLILSGNTLFGTAQLNSTNGSAGGTVFAVETDGTEFAVLHGFYYVGADPSVYANSPVYAGLALSGNTLYGTTQEGGNAGYVYAVNTNGTGFRSLISFVGSYGYRSFGAMVSSGNTLYGTTWEGGSSFFGSIFSIKTDGTEYTELHSCAGNDGGYLRGGLILADGTLYGTAWGRGSSGDGTVFALNTNGTGFTVLHSFAGGDGANPIAGLILSGNALYGTTSAGGSSGGGTVFVLNTNGTGFTVLHNFAGSDGVAPWAGLIFSGNTLYGTTPASANSAGTVFSLTVGSGPQLPDYPAITSQTPASNLLYTVNGATETLGVTATGTDIHYQWFNNSGTIFGATNSSLTLSNVTSAMSGNSYWVVVSNFMGSVTNSKVQLVVELAISQLPTGYWSNLAGIGYWPNVPMTYTIEAGPPAGTIVYAVQEQLTNYPDNTQTNGLSVTNAGFIVGPINDDGTFDSKNYIIKWGPFFDDSPRTLTYVLTPPPGTTNWAVFSGIISIEGTNYPVQGSNAINLLPLHPADNGGNNSQSIDGVISFDEMVNYASSWRVGNLWPVEPNPIPINYMTSAGFIWSQGEYYVYEPSAGDPPNCWVSTNPPPGATQLLPAANSTNSASTVVSSMPTVFTNGVPFTVTLTVTPTNNTMAYAVEDKIPTGWTATNISSSGVYSSFDRYNNEVKWGPIFAAAPATLTYQIIPSTNTTGSASFAGVASFDGADIPITGVRQVGSSIVMRPSIAHISLSGANLTINGTNQSPGTYSVMTSTNLFLPFNQWIPLTTNVLNTSGDFSITATNTVDSKAPERFFILQSH